MFVFLKEKNYLIFWREASCCFLKKPCFKLDELIQKLWEREREKERRKAGTERARESDVNFELFQPNDRYIFPQQIFSKKRIPKKPPN